MLTVTIDAGRNRQPRVKPIRAIAEVVEQGRVSGEAHSALLQLIDNTPVDSTFVEGLVPNVGDPRILGRAGLRHTERCEPANRLGLGVEVHKTFERSARLSRARPRKRIGVTHGLGLFRSF